MQLVTLAGRERETLSDVMIGLDTGRALREFDKLVSRGQHTRVNWAVRNPHLNLLYDYQHSTEAEMESSLSRPAAAGKLSLSRSYCGIRSSETAPEKPTSRTTSTPFGG